MYVTRINGLILNSPREIIPRSGCHGRQNLPSLNYKSYMLYYFCDRKELQGSVQEGKKMPCTPPIHPNSRFFLDICSHQYFNKICLVNIRNETWMDGKLVQRYILKLAAAAQNWDLILMNLRIFHLGEKWGEHLSPSSGPHNCSKAAQWVISCQILSLEQNPNVRREYSCLGCSWVCL